MIRLSPLDISQRNVSWGQFRVAASLRGECWWFVVLCEALRLRAQSSLTGDANLSRQSSVVPECFRWGSFFSDLRCGVVSDTSYSILSYSSRSLSLSLSRWKQRNLRHKVGLLLLLLLQRSRASASLVFRVVLWWLKAVLKLLCVVFPLV